MKAAGTMGTQKIFKLVVGIVLSFSMHLSACKKQTQEAVVSESAVLNGGFRIVPTQAARDVLRPKVIYRCNAVNCGEPFQPSNEERDIVIPCDLDKIKFPAGVIPPYYRTVSERGIRQLIVNVQHQEMCKDPKQFQQVVASVGADPASGALSPEAGCRKFISNEELCKKAEAEGCSWVSHPSGRDSMGRKAQCVGLYSGANVASGSGIEKIEYFQVDKSSVQWAPLESYRTSP